MHISSFTSPIGPVDDVCRSLATSVCPLFVLKAPGQPFLIGSGVPLQVGKISVIATAAHVLKPYGAASVLTLGAEQSVVLTGERRGFEYLPRKTVDVDIAVIVLGDDEREEIHRHYSFSYSSNLAAPHTSRNDVFYGVVGYQQSQNKLSPRLLRTNRGVANYYISSNRVPIAQLNAPGKFDHVHFALGAPRRGAIGLTGRRVSFPSPAGISGGGIWRFDFRKTLAAAPVARLAGILIEYWKQPGAFICTRIAEVEAMTRDLQ